MRPDPLEDPLRWVTVMVPRPPRVAVSGRALRQVLIDREAFQPCVDDDLGGVSLAATQEELPRVQFARVLSRDAARVEAIYRKTGMWTQKAKREGSGDDGGDGDAVRRSEGSAR